MSFFSKNITVNQEEYCQSEANQEENSRGDEFYGMHVFSG